jgi:hypothetical protein
MDPPRESPCPEDTDIQLPEVVHPMYCVQYTPLSGRMQGEKGKERKRKRGRSEKERKRNRLENVYQSPFTKRILILISI